jgi:hypothetical protein
MFADSSIPYDTEDAQSDENIHKIHLQIENKGNE